METAAAAAAVGSEVEEEGGLNQRSAQFILLPPAGSDMGERAKTDGTKESLYSKKEEFFTSSSTAESTLHQVEARLRLAQSSSRRQAS